LSISLVWKILFYGWTAGEVLLVIATRTRRSGGLLRDRGSLLILWASIVGAIFATGSIAQRFPAPMFPGIHWVGDAAIGLMIAGLLVRWIAILSLGKAFSVNVAILEAQTLYRSGLYGIVRHPSYTGMVLIFAALALAERNWWASMVLFLLPTAALFFRIHVEEAALREAFGAEYANYCKATRRLIPGVY